MGVRGQPMILLLYTAELVYAIIALVQAQADEIHVKQQNKQVGWMAWHYRCLLDCG